MGAVLMRNAMQYTQAKAALDDAEIAYDEIDLGQYPKLLAEVKQTTGRSSVPQVAVPPIPWPLRSLILL